VDIHKVEDPEEMDVILQDMGTHLPDHNNNHDDQDDQEYDNTTCMDV
jgi:hypothetical protein